MNTTSTYKPQQQPINIQWLKGLLLIMVMAVTRGGYVTHIQDASWAIIFLIGFYLRNIIGLPIIILAAVTIDFAMIAARGGPQDYYLTPSYLFIIPAYTALWFAGRYFASKYSESIKGLLTFLATAIVGIVICDLISSGGFYWMSSSVMELSMAEFFSRTVEFMPLYLKSTMLYLSVVVIIHFAFIHGRKFVNTLQTQSS